MDFYKNSIQENRADYFFIRNKVRELLETKDSLFKFSVGFTGKRFTEDPYINDTTIFRFYNLHLKDEDQSRMLKIMYNLGLKYVSVYRDSCKFIFNGRYKDTIAIYDLPMLNSGVMIDTHTYLIFAKE